MGAEIYKFKAIDKPLTKEERAEINSWSSRTTATSTSATFVYHYGSFSKNPKTAVKDYFDLHLHFSSYGTKQLILKFPMSIIDYDAIVKFDIENSDYSSSTLEMSRTSNYLIMDFEINDEGDGWIEEDDFDVSEFVSIREDIINGDYSALYVFWMKVSQEVANEDDYYDEDEDDDYYDEDELALPKAPPVPPQLKKISGALQHFIDFFEIDEDLITAAQTISKSLTTETVKKDYPKLIQQLSEKEKEDYLVRLVNGEVRLDLTLKKHLDGFSNTNSSEEKVISFAELRHKQQLEQEKRITFEKAEAKRKHGLKMKDIEASQVNHWRSVFFNLERKAAKSYDLAIITLKELKELAIFKNELAEFNKKMNQIRIDYKRSTSLKRRFDKAGL